MPGLSKGKGNRACPQEQEKPGCDFTSPLAFSLLAGYGVRFPCRACFLRDSVRLAQPARRTHAQHAPHTLEHREQLLVGRVVERVNQIAHLRKLAFQLVEPRLNPIFLRTREHAQASELLA